MQFSDIPEDCINVILQLEIKSWISNKKSGIACVNRKFRSIIRHLILEEYGTETTHYLDAMRLLPKNRQTLYTMCLKRLPYSKSSVDEYNTDDEYNNISHFFTDATRCTTITKLGNRCKRKVVCTNRQLCRQHMRFRVNLEFVLVN